MKSLFKWAATTVIVVATLVGCSVNTDSQPPVTATPNIEDTIEPGPEEGYTNGYVVAKCPEIRAQEGLQTDEPTCLEDRQDGTFKVWMADGTDMDFDFCPDDVTSWCVDDQFKDDQEVYVVFK